MLRIFFGLTVMGTEVNAEDTILVVFECKSL